MNYSADYLFVYSKLNEDLISYIIYTFSSISASTLIIIVDGCVWIILLYGFG